jgi:hypothetical protein
MNTPYESILFHANLLWVDLLEGFQDIQHTRFDLYLVERVSNGESRTLRKAALVKSGERRRSEIARYYATKSNTKERHG